MSKKREEKVDPALGNLLQGIKDYQANHSPEALESIGNAIDQGANSLENLYFGENPFSLAARYGLSEVVELMISKNVDPQKADSAGMLHFPNGTQIGYAATPLHVAVTNKQPQVAKKLLGYMGCNFNKYHQISPLHLAALNQNQNMFQTLLQDGCDPNAQDFIMGKDAHQWAKDYGGESFSNFNFDGAKE